jgi:hypothetical protein
VTASQASESGLSPAVALLGMSAGGAFPAGAAGFGPGRPASPEGRLPFQHCQGRAPSLTQDRPAEPAPGRRVADGPLRRPPGRGGNVPRLQILRRRGRVVLADRGLGLVMGMPADAGSTAANHGRLAARLPGPCAYGGHGVSLPSRMSLFGPLSRGPVLPGRDPPHASPPLREPIGPALSPGGKPAKVPSLRAMRCTMPKGDGCRIMTVAVVVERPVLPLAVDTGRGRSCRARELFNRALSG